MLFSCACLSLPLVQVYMVKANFLTSRGLRASPQFLLSACDFFRWSKAKPEGDALPARLPAVVCEAAHHEGMVRVLKAEKKPATLERKLNMALLSAHVALMFCFLKYRKVTVFFFIQYQILLS